jgi:hypothetical protein
MDTQNIPGPDNIKLGRVGLSPNYYRLGMGSLIFRPDLPIENANRQFVGKVEFLNQLYCWLVVLRLLRR